MTAMDIKVLMPRLIFWGVLIGVVITLFNMCAPDEQFKTNRNFSPELINQIAWAETGIWGTTTTVYLIDGNTKVFTVGIKEIRKEIDKQSNCFIYSKGHGINKGFIFSVQHIINCITKPKDKYDRDIRFRGGWRQRISRDTATKLRQVIEENPECSSSECGISCCKTSNQ